MRRDRDGVRFPLSSRLAVAIWVCTRQKNKIQCGHVNGGRVTYCRACGKPRQKRKPAEHLSVLKLPYEFFEELNGGPNCGICGASPVDGKNNDRDHDHRRSFPRGLLCPRCNRTLDRATRFIATGQEAWWMTRAGIYLTKAEAAWRDEALRSGK